MSDGEEGGPRDPFAGAMPHRDIQADRFLKDHPEYDGRGIVVAIFDTGVDPGAAMLQQTPDGRPKIIDVIDCTGSGDVDTSTVVIADDDGMVAGVRGNKLALNPSWVNPSGEWRVGCHALFDLVPKALSESMCRDRKRVWMEEQRSLLAAATAQVAQLSKQSPPPSKEEREELEARVALLTDLADKATDEGPMLDVVVWKDAADTWWTALDLTELRGQENGALAAFEPMTDFKAQRQYAAFSPSDACNFAVNIYDDGAVLSIVVDAGSHGTHVAGITAASGPELAGVAPGAQLVSCKIGDTRMGSMETGPGLYRALAAVLHHRVDVINMSYGESTSTPNRGRFIELAEEVVREHGVVFVASAGNSGPALSTVGAPGGTSSAILGIGAWVAPEMADAGHAVREALREGQQYNWSSRGPAPDGDTGVALCAPGGAIAPVPRWTRQRRQLMNGTSMASPCAAGAIALILSGLKQLGLRPTSDRLRRGLQATCLQSAWDADTVLSCGAGLIQVADAFEFLRQPCGPAGSLAWEVKVSRSDAGAPQTGNGPARGIYLRTSQEIAVPSTYTVTVVPWFAPEEVAARLDLEVRALLSSEQPSFVSHPRHLLLHATGRSFEIEVDPTGLDPGLHYAEVVGADSQDPRAGRLFALPITVAVPRPVPAGGRSTAGGVEVGDDGDAKLPQAYTFQETLMFAAGMESRHFLEVPEGASWAELRLTATMETPKTLMLRATQLEPQTRFSDTQWSRSAQLSNGTLFQAAFAVKGGTPLEFTIAQMWNSLGSCLLEAELSFHGLVADASAKGLHLDGSAGVARVTLRAPLRPERILPKATLSALSIPLRPTGAEVAPLWGPRDALPRGRLTHQLTLTYALNLLEAGTITPRLPRLNRHVYDGVLDGQMLVVTDANKRVLGWGDIYPEDMPLVAEKKLDPAITVPVYGSHDACVSGGATVKETPLCHGASTALFLGNPPEDKLPKDASSGRLLTGLLSVGTLAYATGKESPDTLALSFTVPPPKTEPSKGEGGGSGTTAEAPDASKELDKAVLAAQVAFLKASDMKDGSEEERTAYSRIWGEVQGEHPAHLPLLTERLTRLENRAGKDDASLQERIAAAEAIVAAIDATALAVYLAQKMPEQGPDRDSRKKEFEQQRDAMVQALSSKTSALLAQHPTPAEAGAVDEVELAFRDLQKWVDTGVDGAQVTLHCRMQARQGRLALAYRGLDKALADDKLVAKHKAMLETRADLLEQLGWTHWASAARCRLTTSFPPAYPLF